MSDAFGKLLDKLTGTAPAKSSPPKVGDVIGGYTLLSKMSEPESAEYAKPSKPTRKASKRTAKAEEAAKSAKEAKRESWLRFQAEKAERSTANRAISAALDEVDAKYRTLPAIRRAITFEVARRSVAVTVAKDGTPTAEMVASARGAYTLGEKLSAIADETISATLAKMAK